MKRFNVAKALKNDEKIYRPLEKAVLYVFSELLYKPIFEIVKSEITGDWLDLELGKILKESREQKEDDLRAEIERNKEVYSYIYHNAKMKDASQNPLVKAILKGRVQYIGGHFEGTFSSAISREIKRMGGVYDSRRKKWRLDSSKLEPQISLAIGTASGKVNRVKSRINGHLEQLGNLVAQDPQFTFDKAFTEALRGLEHNFEEGIEGMIIVPEFTQDMLKNLAEKYNYNMNLYVKGWLEKSIIRLRDRVLINTFEGNRAENLVGTLEHDFQISLNKAKFLARQETSLLMSQFREERYKLAGVQKYRWSTSGDERVRAYHKRLNGQIFTWDNPPIVDETGRRAHPGQDFGCRCVAIPIVD